MRRAADIGTGIIAHPAGRVNEFRVPECETGAMSRLVRRGILVGALVGVGYAAWRFLAARAPRTEGMRFEAQPFPALPRPVAVPSPAAAPSPAPAPTVASTDAAAVEPDADGNCPLDHPIKGKVTTGIYHRPGAFAYDRTRADRCYRDEAAAEADGLRAAKR